MQPGFFPCLGCLLRVDKLQRNPNKGNGLKRMNSGYQNKNTQRHKYRHTRTLSAIQNEGKELEERTWGGASWRRKEGRRRWPTLQALKPHRRKPKPMAASRCFTGACQRTAGAEGSAAGRCGSHTRAIASDALKKERLQCTESVQGVREYVLVWSCMQIASMLQKGV